LKAWDANGVEVNRIMIENVKPEDEEEYMSLSMGNGDDLRAKL